MVLLLKSSTIGEMTLLKTFIEHLKLGKIKREEPQPLDEIPTPYMCELGEMKGLSKPVASMR